MKLDTDKMKAFNQEPEQCWECYNCVKICPQQAIEVRCYADFAPLGGKVVPMRSSDTIMWTVQFRNGNVKRFKFPIRTTAEGSVSLEDGLTADLEKIRAPGLFTHHAAGAPMPTPAS